MRCVVEFRVMQAGEQVVSDPENAHRKATESRKRKFHAKVQCGWCDSFGF